MIITLNKKEAIDLYSFALEQTDRAFTAVKRHFVTEEEYKRMPWWKKFTVWREPRFDGTINYRRDPWIESYWILQYRKKTLIQRLEVIKISESVGVDLEEEDYMCEIIADYNQYKKQQEN